MDKKQLVKHLKEKGYELIEQNKHEHWKNATGHRLTIPTHNYINPRLSKKIICDVKRGHNRIYGVQVAN